METDDDGFRQRNEISEFDRRSQGHPVQDQQRVNKALLLLYLDGYSYGEIADVLGISETNVATKISRLKKTMKHELANAEEA